MASFPFVYLVESVGRESRGNLGMYYYTYIDDDARKSGVGGGGGWVGKVWS